MSKEAFNDNFAEDLGVTDKDFVSRGSLDLEARLLSSEDLSPSLPSMSFASSAVYSREGDDLVLTLNGESVVVANYFATPTPPTLTTMDGAILSPSFIASFLPHGADQNFYASSLLKSLLGGKPVDSNAIAVLESLEGSALVIRNGKAVTLQEGDQIFQGDQISTSPDSSANLIFSDGTQFKIGGEARIALDSFSFESSTSQGLQILSILSGAFSYVSGLVAKNDPANVQLRTPFGEIGIRGTKIVGEVDTENAEVSVTLLEGRVIYKSPQGEEYEINQGFDTLKIKNGGETVRETTISAERTAREYDVFENAGEVSEFLLQDPATLQDPAAQQDQGASEEALPDIAYSQAQAELRASTIASVEISYSQAQAELRASTIANVEISLGDFSNSEALIEQVVSIELQRAETLQEILGKDQTEDTSLVAKVIDITDKSTVRGGDAIYLIDLNPDAKTVLDNQVSVLRGGGVLTGDVLNFVYDTSTPDPTFKFFQGYLEDGLGLSGEFSYEDSDGNPLVRNWDVNGKLGTGGGETSESGRKDTDLMMEITYDTNKDGEDELFVLILTSYFPVSGAGDKVLPYSISFNGVDQGELGGYGENKELVDAALAALTA